MRQELIHLHAQLGTTMIYVTHDQVVAMSMAQNIIVMHKGKVMQMGTPIEIYKNPANMFVAEFIGNPGMVFLKGNIEKSDKIILNINQSIVNLPINLSLDKGNKIMIGVRPEDIVLCKTKEEHINNYIIFQVVVRFMQLIGHEIVMHIESLDNKWQGKALVNWKKNKFQIGEHVYVKISYCDLHFFDLNTDAIPFSGNKKRKNND